MENEQYDASISTKSLVDIKKLFAAIDTVMNLHFAAHTATPLLNNILHDASKLSHRRVDLEALLKIFTVWPDSFTIRGNNVIKNSLLYINFPREHGCLGEERKKELQQRLLEWLQMNPHVNEIPPASLAAVVGKCSKEKAKTGYRDCFFKVKKQQLSSATSDPMKKKLLQDLANDSTKFGFKEKSESVRMKESHGLSLLDRIRLKEQQNRTKESKMTPDMKHHIYIKNKAPEIYEKVFHLYAISEKGKGTKSFPMAKVFEVINDSLESPIQLDEIKDILALTQNVLGYEKLQLLERNHVEVVKLCGLERKDDLKKLIEGIR